MAEALIHETYEYIWGQSHSHACAAELMLTVLRASDAATQYMPGMIALAATSPHP